jgi:hypothetical protein
MNSRLGVFSSDLEEHSLVGLYEDATSTWATRRIASTTSTRKTCQTLTSTIARLTSSRKWTRFG